MHFQPPRDTICLEFKILFEVFHLEKGSFDISVFFCIRDGPYWNPFNHCGLIFDLFPPTNHKTSHANKQMSISKHLVIIIIIRKQFDCNFIDIPTPQPVLSISGCRTSIIGILSRKFHERPTKKIKKKQPKIREIWRSE